MSDATARFLDTYSAGNTAEALRHVLDGSAVEYEELASGDSRRDAILNYVDALAFGSAADMQWTGKFLIDALSERSPALAFDLMLSKVRDNPLQPALPDWSGGDAAARRAVRAWARGLGETASPHDSNLGGALETLAPPFRNLLAVQVQFSAACDAFWQRHQRLFEALGKPDRSHAPLVRTPDARTLKELDHGCQSAASGDLPLVLMEGYEADWASILTPLANRPACFLFRDPISLSHCLSMAAVADALNDPAHGLIVLDRYVAPQLAAQPHASRWPSRLAPIVAWDADEYLTRVPAALDALTHVLSEPQDGSESPAANWLYRVGQQASIAIRARRLGVRRLPYLRNQLVHAGWNDPHKGEPPPGVSTGPAAPDLLNQLIGPLQPISARRRPAATGRLRLAHVTTQVVDGGHAPSRLLRTLAKFHDRRAFDLSFFVTEGFVRRSNEYPTSLWQSTPSTERAPRTLGAFRQAGLKVAVASPADDYWTTARSFARQLSDDKVDVAVFHGPDFIHHAIATLTDVPLRVLFEHGSLPGRPGFDVAVASAESEEGVERLKPQFAAMGTTLVRNAHVVDARASWLAEPYALSALGMPDDALVMTTISNHLEHRLSEPMCLAIVEILERCPRAWYAPMGPVRPDSRVARFFAASPVGDRVRLLGSVHAPSQYARSMHLYLNEFPFGGGIALLDALAAGCPIVSMYDKAGPAQARYVGLYYGMDRVITSLDPKDYVDLACRLLTDTALYDEWRRAALQRYEAHTDVRAYVKRFEDIVRDGLARLRS